MCVWFFSEMAKRKKKKKKPQPIEKILKSIYENVNHPASFSSVRRLFQAAKKQDKKIKLSQVQEWLESHRTYSLHRRVVEKFTRRRVLVRGPQHQYQADLMDFQPLARENSGHRYLLTVIDCFSRFAGITPLKNKKGDTVVEGLDNVFKFMGYPVKLQTDHGTEFYNAHAKAYFQRKKIVLFSTQQSVKAALVERFNRTVRDKIKKYMSHHQTLRYLDAIPGLLQAYNSRPHSALGPKPMSPQNVNEANRKQVHSFMYGKYLAQRNAKCKFQVGDRVRITAYREQFRGRNKQNWTEDIFTVAEVRQTHPPTYLLLDPQDHQVIDGTFYEQQMQKWRGP